MKNWIWWAVGAIVSAYVFLKLLFYTGPVPEEVTVVYAGAFLALMIAYAFLFCFCVAKVIAGLMDKENKSV